MALPKLEFNLLEAKEAYACFADTAKNKECEYLNSLHSLAFSKDTKGLKAIAKLLIFFALKCEKFEVISPKDEFGLVILDIADAYKNSLKPNQAQISEAITALLLECEKLNAKYESVMYLELREYVSNLEGHTFKAMNSEYEIKTKRISTENPDTSLNFADKTYVTKNGMHETYNPLTATNYQKLKVAEEIGEFKNAQVKERTIEAFKRTHNCEPTKDEAEKDKMIQNFARGDNKVYTHANARILNIL